MKNSQDKYTRITRDILFENLLEDGCPENTYHWAKKNLYSLLVGRTPYEVRVSEFLNTYGVYYITQAPFYLRSIGKLCFADFYVPKGKYLIEVDGGYHKKAEKRATDLLQDAEFRKLGYKVVRIANAKTKKDKIISTHLVNVVGRKVVDKKIENDTQARERELELEKKREEQRLKMEKGEGKWASLRKVVEILEKAPEKSEILLKTPDKEIAKEIILAFQGKAGLFGLPGDITIICRQRFLQVFVMYYRKNIEHIKNYLAWHKNSIIAGEYVRILGKFGYDEFLSKSILL